MSPFYSPRCHQLYQKDQYSIIEQSSTYSYRTIKSSIIILRQHNSLTYVCMQHSERLFSRWQTGAWPGAPSKRICTTMTSMHYSLLHCVLVFCAHFAQLFCLVFYASRSKCPSPKSCLVWPLKHIATYN